MTGTLTTACGRRLVVAWDHDQTAGRTAYTVRHPSGKPCGVFVVEPDWSEYPEVTGRLYVQYGSGRRHRSEYNGPPDDAPQFFGVVLSGGAFFHPDTLSPTGERRPDSTYGGRLWPHRSTGRCTSESVPYRTAVRATEYVHALAQHWLALPETGLVREAQARALAPERYVGHLRTMRDRAERMAVLKAEYDEAAGLADAQVPLLPDDYHMEDNG